MRKNWLLLLVAVPTSCFGAYWFGSGWTKPAVVKPENGPPDYTINGLVANQSDLDLGEVWEERDFATVLPIVNQTDSPIEVVDFAVSCGCLAVEPRSLTIPARDTALVRLKFDLSKQNRPRVADTKRPLEVNVTPLFRSGWPKAPGWKLTGMIKSRVTLDKSAVNFGDTFIQGQSPPQQTVRATTHVPTERLEVIVNPPLATVQSKRLEGSSEKFQIVITPLSTLPVGPFKFEVTVDPVSPTGERLAGVRLPVEGTTQPEIRPLPARLFLGSHALGESVEAFVVLQAQPGTAVLVDQIEADTPDVDVAPFSIEGSPPGRTFRVLQRITKSGDQISVIRFTLHKPDRQRQTLSMDICYRGELKNSDRNEQKAGTQK